MNIRLRLIGWLVVATAMLMLAAAVEASGLLPGASDWLPQKGFGAAPLLLVDLLLVVTVLFYLLAPVVPQQRLALAQAIANVAFGIGMILGGILVALAGLATFVGLIALLLAFPFGTIAYFAEFGCGSQAMTSPAWAADAAGTLGRDCFDAARGAIVLGLALKIAGLVALIVAAVKFLTVRGLILLFVISAALTAGVLAVLILLSDFAFVLYPVDALLTILVGLVAAVYGIVVAVKGMFALAMAVAAQVA